MKNNHYTFLFLMVFYPWGVFAYTIDKPHYDGGLEFSKVNCENGTWDYIWFDGDTFYIEGLDGERKEFKNQRDAAQYFCKEED